MSSTLTWIGGGNDDASNPKDWSPTGSPRLGHTLLIDNGGTINITGHALAGNVLSIEPSSTGLEPTLNLDDAKIALGMVNQPPEFSDPAPYITLNVAGGSDSVTAPASNPIDNTMINLQGNAHLLLSGGMYFISASGGAHSELINDGRLELARGIQSGTIDTNLTGTGVVSTAYLLTLSLTIDGSVGAGQTVDVMAENTLVLDKPLAFAGTVNAETFGPDALVIDLMGVTATSYEYSNDLLKLYNGNRVADTLKLTAMPPYVIPTSAGIELSYGQGPVAPPHLPVHS